MDIEIRHLARIPLPNNMDMKALIMSMFCYETRAGDIFQNYEYRNLPDGSSFLYVPPNIQKIKSIADMLGYGIVDSRSSGARLDYPFMPNPVFKFRPHQEDPANLLVRHMRTNNYAVAVGGCGVGKSAIGAYVAGCIGTKVLVLVDMSSLAVQWEDAFSLVWGRRVQHLKAADVAFSDVCCTTFQLLHRNPALLSRIRTEFGTCIIDEFHTAKATSFKQVLFRLDNKYRIGLTATFFSKTIPTAALEDLMSPVTVTIKDTNALVPTVEFVKTGVDWCSNNPDEFGNKVVPQLASDPTRNLLIARLAAEAARQGRVVAVICMTITQAKMLEGAIKALGGTPVVYTGTTSAKKDKEVKDGLESGRYNVVLTAKKLDKGWDCPRLDTVIMGRPFNNKEKVQQITGRIVRNHDEKHDPLVIDLVDEGDLGMAATFTKNRKRFYKELKYNISSGTILLDKSVAL